MLYPELIYLSCLKRFNQRKRLLRISLKSLANEERAEIEDVMAAIVLMVIIILLFFAPNLAVFFFFMFAGIIIGIIQLKRWFGSI